MKTPLKTAAASASVAALLFASSAQAEFVDIETALANNLPCGSTLDTSCVQRWTTNLPWKNSAQGFVQTLITPEGVKICDALWLIARETTPNTLKFEVVDGRRINVTVKLDCLGAEIGDAPAINFTSTERRQFDGKNCALDRQTYLEGDIWAHVARDDEPCVCPTFDLARGNTYDQSNRGEMRSVLGPACQ